MKLQETKHEYYCSENNYYVGNYNGENHGRCDYETWSEFKKEWLGIGEDELWLDDDYNHVFRFDILEKKDDDERRLGEFELWLFFILQRKGIYRPVWIKKITQDDMSEINEFLKNRWSYMQNQWHEFSNITKEEE